MQKSSQQRSLLFAALAAALAISVSEAQLPKKGNRGNRCASWCRSPRDHCPKELCAGCVALCAQYREDITHPCPAVAKWDTAYETCLDWCRPLEESSHCGKCSCKACPSCRGGGGGSAQKPAAAPVATPTRSAAPAAAPAAASGSAAPAQAVLVRGVLARGSECEPNDSSDVATAQCELDCSLSRCQQCRCASCPFCAAGPAAPSTAPIQCAPLDNADTTVQQCAAMCQPEHASNYCKRCQCGACAFCGGSLAPPPPPPPAAAAHAPLLRPPPPPPEESRVGYSQPEAGNLLGRSRLGDGASVAWRRACEQQVNSGREAGERELPREGCALRRSSTAPTLPSALAPR